MIYDPKRLSGWSKKSNFSPSKLFKLRVVINFNDRVASFVPKRIDEHVCELIGKCFELRLNWSSEIWTLIELFAATIETSNFTSVYAKRRCDLSQSPSTRSSTHSTKTDIKRAQRKQINKRPKAATASGRVHSNCSRFDPSKLFRLFLPHGVSDAAPSGAQSIFLLPLLVCLLTLQD